MVRLCVLALTVSYHSYHQSNDDPDHDASQETHEEDEDQAEDHGDNKASVESRARKQGVSEEKINKSNNNNKKPE